MASTNTSEADTQFREQLRRYEERMHPHYALGFDGTKLTLRENGEPIMRWPAVSGRPETQGPEHQSYRDYGPLPQGSYRAKISEMQRRADTTTLEKLGGLFDAGPWPGGAPAWGNYRFWLRPDADTETFGRDNFSIHGGWTRDRQAA